MEIPEQTDDFTHCKLAFGWFTNVHDLTLYEYDNQRGRMGLSLRWN